MSQLLALAGTVCASNATPLTAGQRAESPSQQQILRDCQHSDYSAIVIRSCTAVLNSATADAELRAQVYTWRGNAWIKDRDAEAAISDFTRALELDANDSVARRGRARAHEMRGDHLAAVKDWTALIALNNSNPESYRDRAYAHTVTGDHSAAITDFTKAIALDDSNADAYVGRALAYDNLNKLPDALADFERALAKKPNFIRAFVARGDMWERRGEREKAIADLQRALQINSFNLVVRKSLQRLGIYHPYP